MSYQHKKSIVVGIASIITFGLFNIYWLGKYPDLLRSSDTALWGKTIVIMIMVQVISQILVTILFNTLNQIIAGESEPRVRDELDKLISLRVMRNSYIAFIIIFILSMVLMMTGQSINTMFNLLYFGLIGSGIFGEVTEFIYYRRGY